MFSTREAVQRFEDWRKSLPPHQMAIGRREEREVQARNKRRMERIEKIEERNTRQIEAARKFQERIIRVLKSIGVFG
ncbi:hypothetical protein IT418_01940 [bacterium]|nr:hypothetical protein [bacterium]